MGEIIHEALLIYNLPLTLMLGLSVAYWISVCFGMLDVGSFDADVELGADAAADVDVDVDATSTLTATLVAGS